MSWNIMLTMGVLLAFCESTFSQDERPGLENTNPESTSSEQIFSGPQAGEHLPPFVVQGVFDDFAGKDVNFVEIADGGPVVLIFVHDVNRQSISLARILATYTVSRSNDGLVTGMILLNDDATDAESQLKRMKHAIGPVNATISLSDKASKEASSQKIDYATVGISKDGREGPGSYGLNRNVTMTILVGADNKVTANYALIQPSLQVDLPKILESVVDVVGGRVPRLDELEGMPAAMRRNESASATPDMRSLLGPLIRREATDEEVATAAKKVETAAAENEAVRNEVGRIANTIINAGKLENYGTPACQEYLRKWATEFGNPGRRTQDDGKSESKR